jgi:hypothetical protein
LDNLLVLDNALTADDCQVLINSGSKNLISTSLETTLGYEFKEWKNWNNDPIVRPLTDLLVQKYIEQFPAITYTKTVWGIGDWRFKHFPPGYSFNEWHSEHDYNNSTRIACILVYLSDHDCGTEFLSTQKTVKSCAGRAIMFPTSWTHTHRGQVCPENKSRYIMSAYAYLTDKTQIDE